MRLILIGVALLFTTSASAQSRWTLSAGPEWTPYTSSTFYGGRVRAEYDLTKPSSPLRLRLEAGGLWSPTQSFYTTYNIVDGTIWGTRQSLDFSFGLSVALTPLPKARFSPYVLVAGVARQTWRRESSWVLYSGSAPEYFPEATRTSGKTLLQRGLGIRARIARHMFQLEWRRYEHDRSLTLGTQLPF